MKRSLDSEEEEEYTRWQDSHREIAMILSHMRTHPNQPYVCTRPLLGETWDFLSIHMPSFEMTQGEQTGSVPQEELEDAWEALAQESQELQEIGEARRVLVEGCGRVKCLKSSQTAFWLGDLTSVSAVPDEHSDDYVVYTF